LTGKRIVLLDALRGVCFVLMTVDHLPWSPVSRFSNPNYGLFGFFTALLGFIFLSGVVGGLVYEEHRVRHGLRAMTRRVARRARALYATQILLLLILLAAVTLHLPGVSRWHLGLLGRYPWEGALYGASLMYEPGYLGILPMYCLFLLLTPVLISQFTRGHVWHVLCASAALWIVSGLVIRLPNDPYGFDFGAFNPFGYQFVFVAGLALGAGRIRIDQISREGQRWLFATALVIAAAFFVLRLGYALYGPLIPEIDRLANAAQLGPLRMVNFAAFSLLIYWAALRVRWKSVDAAPFRWFAFVGRNSLPVFAWSILVAYAASAAFPEDPGRAVRIAVLVVAAASLTIPAQIRATYFGLRSGLRPHQAPPASTRYLTPSTAWVPAIQTASTPTSAISRVWYHLSGRQLRL